MDLTVKNYNLNQQRRPQFKGVLDGVVTNTMRCLDTNEMINAVVLDVGPMSLPRAWYDGTHRNKYAGMETLARELDGTFINCLSAGIFALAITKLASKWVMPEVQINSGSWFSNDSLQTLQEAWKHGGETLEGYVKTVFNNLSGLDGFNVNEFKNIDWEKIEWIDKKSWGKIRWNNVEYKDIQNMMKTKDGFINSMVRIINDKNIAKDDYRNVLQIMNTRLTNALGVERSASLKLGETKISDKLEIILRDTYDMGKNIFTNNNIDKNAALAKIAKINKMKIAGALTLSCLLGLTNQYINRKITEKRTGIKGFVGDVNYTSADRKAQAKDNWLMLKKLAASVGMIGMVLAVMRVKNWQDFVKKLEFTGPVTSGNAIKTVYASNIVGRFMAADNGTELRESMTRDYLGFLNWLVFGGFAAKGVANLFDRKGEELFNYTGRGKGLRHWLNDMSLKTHNEIAAKGVEFAKRNMSRLNFSHACGITYSAVTLGLILPMINDKLTKYKARKAQSTN